MVKDISFTSSSEKENSSTNDGHNNLTNSTFDVYHDQDGKEKIGQIRQFVRVSVERCVIVLFEIMPSYYHVL